jgi:hypothetical protein
MRNTDKLSEPLSFEKWWPVIQELKKLHIGLMVETA